MSCGTIVNGLPCDVFVDLNVLDDLTVAGDAAVGGTLAVTGTAAFGNTLAVVGATGFQGDCTVGVGDVSATNRTLHIDAGTTGESRLYLGDSVAGRGQVVYSHADEYLAFGSAGALQWLIDSGGTLRPWNAGEYIGASTIGPGALILGTNATNNAAKYGYVAGLHWTSSTEEAVMAIQTRVAAAQSYVDIGGADAAFNAATDIRFWTAANNTTVTGTLRGGVDQNGLLDWVLAVRGTGFIADGDPGGIASTVTTTNVVDGVTATPLVSLFTHGSLTLVHKGWRKVYSGTTAYYQPLYGV